MIITTTSQILQKDKRYSALKGGIALSIWGAIAMAGFVVIIWLIMSTSWRYSEWNDLKNTLENRLTLAKTMQEKARLLMARDDLHALSRKLHKPFDKDIIDIKNIESWALSLDRKHPPYLPFDITTTLSAEEFPHNLGHSLEGRMVTFRIKTYTDVTFFSFLDNLAQNAPFYNEVKNYTLKRLQPLTEDVLMNIQHGKTSYLFEGSIDVLVVAPSFDDESFIPNNHVAMDHQ